MFSVTLLKVQALNITPQSELEEDIKEGITHPASEAKDGKTLETHESGFLSIAAAATLLTREVGLSYACNEVMHLCPLTAIIFLSSKPAFFISITEVTRKQWLVYALDK